VIADDAAIDLEALLRDERAKVERALERACEWLAEGLPDELFQPARHAVLSGGKRLRPVLCVVAYRACGGVTGSAAYDLGAAIELIHAYSLMHDDLPCMDDADLRRGQPTPHTIYGEANTARAGLALIPAASLWAFRASIALGLDEGASRAIVNELNRASGAGGMVGGQTLDLLGEGQRLDSNELDRLHGMKTGALITASLKIGGIAAGASDATLDGLGSFGRGIGLAFQVTDDILDATALAADLGKHPSDSLLDKSTYVALYGLEKATERARALAEDASDALRRTGIEAPALTALAAYVVERKK
jgi:geranylgeranyl diphosphate synthase type II